MAHQEPYMPEEAETLGMHDDQDEAYERGVYDPQECSCDTGGLYSPGTVPSIRAGETDPFCTIHGIEDIRNGCYALNPARAAEIDRDLA